jgi:hypothetical protein
LRSQEQSENTKKNNFRRRAVDYLSEA